MGISLGQAAAHSPMLVQPPNPSASCCADHRHDSVVALRLTLGQQPEVRHLGAHEQHPRCVGAGGDAGAAPDAGGRRERLVDVVLGDEHRVRVRCRAGVHRHEPAGLDDPVERGPVHDEVLEHRERRRAPRLDGDGVAVRERAHVQLAGRRHLRTVRLAVDHQAAHAADALAAVAVERDRVLAVEDEPLVEDVEHLEERHVRGHVVDVVGDQAALGVRGRLPPDPQGDSHL